MEVTVKIRPIEIDEITPAAAWKQYVNLELTEEDETAGKNLVTHDIQATRAVNALAAAVGDVEWTAAATQHNTDAPGKQMDQLQLGRTLKIEVKLRQAIEGVKIYFGFAAEATNPAWAGAPNALKAAICMRRNWRGKDKWETTFGGSSYTKTDANGKATARLRLSRFGGDQYKAVASLKRDPLTNGANEESALITVWRKIWYQPTYNKDYPLMSLAQAAGDFAQCFVELEAIDSRPYAADASIAESDAWQFDEGKLKGMLAPGQTAKVEVVPQKKDALPRTGRVKFSQTPSPSDVIRDVALRKAAKLKLNTVDVTLVDKKVGQPFTPLSHDFEVENEGHATLDYSVAKTRDWITLSSSGGSIAGGATETVTVTIDGDTVSNLAPGDYEETLTFSNAQPVESKERKIKLKVLPDTGGALVVTPPGGLTSEGKVGGPFDDPKGITYTLENKGGAEVSYSASVSTVPWLTVTYKARTDLVAAHEDAKQKSKEAKDKVAPLEQQATDLEQQAETAKQRQAEVEQAGAEKVKQAQARSAAAAQQATVARDQAAAKATERDRVVREEDGLVKQAEQEERQATEEHRRLQDHADGVRQRAKTPEARGEAERASEEAGEAKEQATRAGQRLEQARSQASRNKKQAKDDWSAADRQAKEAATLAETASAELTSTCQQVEIDDRAAAEELAQATATAKQKRDEATKAKADAEAAKEKATAAKDASKKGVGKLASGASTTVQVTVNEAKAAELNALPAQQAVTFTDETNHRNQQRTIRLAKPGKLKVTGGNYEPTAQAGAFSNLSKDYILENEGDVDLDYTVTKTKPWVTLSSSAGSVRSGAPVTVKVTVNKAAVNTFEAGEHVDKVTIKDISHNVEHEKDVKVTVTANANPVLAVVPWEDMECIGNDGGPFNPATKTYTLKNIGGAALKYKVKPSNWLVGSTPGKLIAVGDHNKAHMWGLRQQPADERPRTVQLVVCQKQCDPETTDAVTKQSSTREFAFDATEVVNADGDSIEVVTPPIDGGGGDRRWHLELERTQRQPGGARRLAHHRARQGQPEHGHGDLAHALSGLRRLPAHGGAPPAAAAHGHHPRPGRQPGPDPGPGAQRLSELSWRGGLREPAHLSHRGPAQRRERLQRHGVPRDRPHAQHGAAQKGLPRIDHRLIQGLARQLQNGPQEPARHRHPRAAAKGGAEGHESRDLAGPLKGGSEVLLARRGAGASPGVRHGPG